MVEWGHCGVLVAPGYSPTSLSGEVVWMSSKFNRILDKNISKLFHAD